MVEQGRVECKARSVYVQKVLRIQAVEDLEED
jgi:hypothetical protein